MTQATIDLAIPASPIPTTRTLEKDANRRTFRFPNGKRCKLLVVDSGFTLCFQHAKLKLDHRELADLSADLFGDDLTELRTTDQINCFLTRVVRLLAQNRISPGRAVVLTYATSLLLPGVAAMDRQASVGGPCAQIIWDSPLDTGDDARHSETNSGLG
jgi:hypothetical protein